MAYLCKMLRKSVWLHLLVFFSAALMASDSLPSFDRIDRHIDLMSYVGEDLDSLALMVTIPCQSDFEKLRAVFKYVITYITYDGAAYKNGQRRINQNNTDVLRRREAVCWGYAQLITELCGKLKIPCYTITGYAKDSPVPPRSFEKANHAWNAVYLAGEWYLLDATWGAVLQSGDNYFSRKYGLNYFLSDPAIFGRSHHPLMPMWQLLTCPIAYAAFISDHHLGERLDCGYNFRDSIAEYSQWSYLDQQLKIMQVAFEINRTATNRSQVGHALVDIAIQKKEHGDQLLELDSHALAMEELDASLQLFALAKKICTFYPWQEEAHVFTAVNLAQATYSIFAGEVDKVDLIVDRFRAAKILIEDSRLKKPLTQQAESLINEYLQLLESY